MNEMQKIAFIRSLKNVLKHRKLHRGSMKNLLHPQTYNAMLDEVKKSILENKDEIANAVKKSLYK
jgi:hypothetical protein